jgi:hypothetical protein
MATPSRFPIQFDPWFAVLSSSMLLFPSSAYVDVAGDRISVRMGWAFRSTFDRARIAAVSKYPRSIALTRGVHGWRGKWLVNGAGDGVVEIELEPEQRAYVLGLPVGLRRLLVSVADPGALVDALRPVA